MAAQHLIQSVESLLPQLNPTKTTVLVLDNAPIHRAKLVREKQQEWKRQGLRLFFLPPYCSYLNRIEVLWKQIKYRWLSPQAYADFDICAVMSHRCWNKIPYYFCIDHFHLSESQCENLVSF